MIPYFIKGTFTLPNQSLYDSVLNQMFEAGIASIDEDDTFELTNFYETVVAAGDDFVDHQHFTINIPKSVYYGLHDILQKISLIDGATLNIVSATHHPELCMHFFSTKKVNIIKNRDLLKAIGESLTSSFDVVRMDEAEWEDKYPLESSYIEYKETLCEMAFEEFQCYNGSDIIQ